MLTVTPKPGVELLIVEVPVTATEPWMMETEFPTLGYYDPTKALEDNMWSASIKLPPGSWTFIATTDTLTEEQANLFVQHIHFPLCTGYRNYTDRGAVKFKALDSFRSLIQSAGGDAGKCYAILLKQ